MKYGGGISLSRSCGAGLFIICRRSGVVAARPLWNEKEFACPPFQKGLLSFSISIDECKSYASTCPYPLFYFAQPIILQLHPSFSSHHSRLVVAESPLLPLLLISTKKRSSLVLYCYNELELITSTAEKNPQISLVASSILVKIHDKNDSSLFHFN